LGAITTVAAPEKMDPTYDEKINPYVVVDKGVVLQTPQLLETAD